MLLPSIDAVDAALAALTGLRALEGQFTAIGDPAEGVIVVPVAPLPAAPLTRPLTGVMSNLPFEPIGGAPVMSGRSRTRTGSVNGTPGSPSRLCGCGCGVPVSRHFLPGHDAKLTSRLLRDARLGDTAAEQQLSQFGWLARDPADPPTSLRRMDRREK
ncbi:hypothetical protein MTY59_39080 [Mycobacterium senriense]|uniref:Uncharacterized protein n=1 Tax=Mycobacterium senriense TaxID=2775496 RepID=A0ABM7SUU8_9MYCO|nr:hypothetical protein MTY59_39080 [Mycobacterium senriense]